MILYGIPNCDTVRKARRWLDGHAIACTFHDYKKAGIEHDRLERWADKVGWELLLNRRGTTWRTLPDAQRTELAGADAIELMVANTSLIKRPVLEHGDRLLVGFDEAGWLKLLVDRGASARSPPGRIS